MSKNKSELDTSMAAGQTKAGGDANPFTADLKGEFTSNFGTNTNAVSDLLKSGSNSNKYKLFGGAILVLTLVAGGLYLYLPSQGSEDEFAAEGTEPVTTDPDALGEEGDPAAPLDDAMAQNDAMGAGEATPDSAVKTQGEPQVATDAPATTSPTNGQARLYDETSSDAEFTWGGSPGGYISFSRTADMRATVRRTKVEGNSYVFRHPWPGTWYWQVENDAGKSAVESFSVAAPVRRNIAVSSPQAGATLPGNGGLVSWNSDEHVSRYKVELSTGDWANPAHRQQTVGTDLQLSGVAPGTYQMRVGAWSDVAGRWEYTAPMAVTIQ
jgi:hypothetical protein